MSPTPKPNLAEALEQLKTTLERHRAIHQDVTPPAPPEDPSASPLDRLGRALCLRTGLVMSDNMRQKLARILGRIPAVAVSAWVAKLESLDVSAPDWASLIENLTVHETFFFRDWGQMRLLRDRILPSAIADAERNGRHRLVLWSAGCATGEEAYSVAILALEALHAAGHGVRTARGRVTPVSHWSVEVIGTDISRPVVARAEQGRFTQAGGLSPFRDMPDAYAHWFDALDPSEDESGADIKVSRVAPELAAICRFTTGNLLRREGLDQVVDIILCRNVLIYLEEAVRCGIQEWLAACLRPGGHLLLGPADQLQPEGLFEMIWDGHAIGYRRR